MNSKNIPDSEEPQAPEPLAFRRIDKLRREYPEESPQQIIDRLESLFIRDFILVGGTETGIRQMLPGAVHAASCNSKVAGLTRAASQLGVMQGMPTYTQKTAESISTAAHVGSSQSIKTFVFALALLYGLPAEDPDSAASQVLPASVHQLLLTMDQPIAHRQEQAGVNPLNVVAAISQIGMRNPQLFLLTKAGEQLIRSGSSVVETSRARQAFASQLASDVRAQLGEAPKQFPPAFKLDNAELGPAEVVATPAEFVQATSEEELQRIAKGHSLSAKGARWAARAFVRGSEKFKNRDR